MKHFLVYILALLLVLISLECLLYIIPNNYSYKAKYINDKPERIKTLVLGASHAENCINTILLGDSAFNMGGSAKPYYFDAAFIKKNIDKMLNLKCVIMTVAPFQQYRSYSHNISPKDNLSALEPYIRCMHLRYLGIHYGKYDYWYYLELPNSKGNLKSKIISSGVSCDSLGYVPLDTSNRKNDWRHNQLPRPIDYTNEMLPLAYEDNLVCMKELAMICKEYHVRLVFVSIPYLELARQSLPKVDLDGLYAFINELKKVNPNIEYLNYIYDSRFVENDFFNSVHLAKEGTDKFTKILHDDLKLN